MNNNKNRYNKYKNIEIKSFYDTDDVNNLIDEKIEEIEEDESIVIYGKRDLISELFVNMIKNDYDFGYIDLDNVDDLLKNEVYIMTIDNNYRINIECAYDNGNIVGHNAQIALFYTDDCKQDIIDYCIDNDMKVILFDFENDEGYCGGCNCGDCKDCKKQGNCNDCNDCNQYNDQNNCDNHKGKLNTKSKHADSKSVTVNVLKTENGTPNGFAKSWYAGSDNTLSLYTYTFQSDDLGVLRRAAKAFDVDLK